MRKRVRSKKGLTLVELVVTVAILGIVSGLSLTIVVSAMNNYSEAAMMEKEQNVALLLEDYLVRNARVCRKAKVINTGTVSAIPDTASFGFYVAEVNDVVRTFDYSLAGEKEKLTYENVKQVTVRFERQKRDQSELEDGSSIYLNYKIEMDSGYTLTGQTVMNNIDKEEMATLITGQTDRFVDYSPSYSLIVTGVDTAIVFNF